MARTLKLNRDREQILWGSRLYSENYSTEGTLVVEETLNSIKQKGVKISYVENAQAYKEAAISLHGSTPKAMISHISFLGNDKVELGGKYAKTQGEAAYWKDFKKELIKEGLVCSGGAQTFYDLSDPVDASRFTRAVQCLSRV